MYKCQQCNQVVPAKTKANRITVETRYKQYPFRAKVMRQIEAGKVKMADDPGGTGYEIVRELVVCPDCAAKFQQQNVK